jgi:selenocysteine lyase/cysteine desulfurase
LPIYIFRIRAVSNIKILAGQHQDRLGVISFYVDDLHFNLGVKLLNDKYKNSRRCSCWYLWTLLHVDQETHKLIDEITLGDLIRKPGWIRMSVHPTTTNAEIEFVCTSIKALAENHKKRGLWIIPRDTNEFIHKRHNIRR